MSDWETVRKPALMKRLLVLPREEKIKLIKRAREYRSGTDSCNSVYMGSMAISMLCRALGGIYGNDDVDYLLTKASDHNLDTALNVCASYIETMEKHPTKPCPCCGQITNAFTALEPSAARELALEEVKTSGATDVRGLIKTYANAAFEQQGKDIPKYIWHLHFEEFATAIRALSSPDHADAGKVEGDGWNPIESAPKDGTRILLYAAEWSAPCTGQYYGEPRGWGGFYDVGMYKHQPTHWRPLPSAPASEGAE